MQVELQMWSFASTFSCHDACSIGSKKQNELHEWIKHFVIEKRQQKKPALSSLHISRRSKTIIFFPFFSHLCDRCTFSVWDTTIISCFCFFHHIFITVGVSPIISLRLSHDKNASFLQRWTLRRASHCALSRLGSHAAPCRGRPSHQHTLLFFCSFLSVFLFIYRSLQVKSQC